MTLRTTSSPESKSAAVFETDEFRSLLSVSSEAKAILTLEGTFVRLDAHWEALLGLSHDEIVGKPLAGFLTDGDRRAPERLLQALQREGTVMEFTMTVMRRDRCRVLSVNANLTGDQVFLCARDVTSERYTLERLEEVNRRSKARVDVLRTICRVQGRAVFEDDPASLFDFLLAELLRITESEYGFIGETRSKAGKPVLRTHAITNIAWNDETLAFYRENAPDGLEFTNLATLFGRAIIDEQAVIANDPADDPRAGGLPEGHPPLRAFLAMPLKDKHGLVGLVGIANRPRGYDQEIVDLLEPLMATCTSCIRASKLRDDRNRTGKELRKSESRRQQLELAHMSRVAAAGELSASLAHELNQPLSAILTNARAAQRFQADGFAPEEVDETLKDIVSDAGRAGEIIQKLRQFLRKGAPDVRPLDLNAVVRGVVDLLSGIDSRSTSCIRLDLSEALPLIEADQVQIEQVLVNLIRNGIDAMEQLPVDERALRIATSVSDAGISCSVTDRGPGIDDPTSIFDPFFTTKPEGLGMGLPISRTIIESHGGHLQVTSPAEGGARLEFLFPLKEA